MRVSIYKTDNIIYEQFMTNETQQESMNDSIPQIESVKMLVPKNIGMEMKGW